MAGSCCFLFFFLRVELAAMWMGHMIPPKQLARETHGGLKLIKVGCIFSFCKPSYIRRTWRNMLQTHWINCRAELVSKISAINIGRGLTIDSYMVERTIQAKIIFLGITDLQYWIDKSQEATCLAKGETFSNRTFIPRKPMNIWPDACHPCWNQISCWKLIERKGFLIRQPGAATNRRCIIDFP